MFLKIPLSAFRILALMTATSKVTWIRRQTILEILGIECGARMSTVERSLNLSLSSLQNVSPNYFPFQKFLYFYSQPLVIPCNTKINYKS